MDLGCDEILTYEQVLVHDSDCHYAVVKCTAFNECKT